MCIRDRCKLPRARNCCGSAMPRPRSGIAEVHFKRRRKGKRHNAHEGGAPFVDDARGDDDESNAGSES
eukprot:1680082-Alexandrium_andersonii.AAC.1